MSMLLNPFWYPTSCRVAVTVPAGRVPSNLVGFPVYVDLSTLPASFWDKPTNTDGGHIRVRTETGAEVPFDLVYFAPSLRLGTLFFRADLSPSADTTVYIHYGDARLSPVAHNAPNGREAVWADYECVFFFGGDLADHSGNVADAKSIGHVNHFRNVSNTGDIGVHQGIAFDSNHYYYGFDTNAIKKYDLNWTLIATNSNPCGDVGHGVNHLGDGEVYNGMLYVPIETYTNITTHANQRIARFDAATLDFIDSVDVSAQGHDMSALAYNPVDGLLYVASYADGSRLWKYHPRDLTYQGQLMFATTLQLLQGITFWKGDIYVNSDQTKSTHKLKADGTHVGQIWGDMRSTCYEGLTHTEDALLALDDAGCNSHGIVRRLEQGRAGPYGAGTQAGPAGTGFFVSASDSYIRIDGVARFTQWTLGATVNVAAGGANRAIVTYCPPNNNGAANRSSLAYRGATGRIGLWDTANTWIEVPGTVAADAQYRVHAASNGTTQRKVARDGMVAVGASSGYPVAGSTTLYVGIGDQGLADDMNGAISFVYLRGEYLGPDWLTAEKDNLANPAAFYTVGSEDPLVN